MLPSQAESGALSASICRCNDADALTYVDVGRWDFADGFMHAGNFAVEELVRKWVSLAPAACDLTIHSCALQIHQGPHAGTGAGGKGGWIPARC